jgi:predicted phage baseplate assembly protein
MWSNIDPLELGAGKFPPTLDETNLQSRVITWLRIRLTNGSSARFVWTGINTVFVTQRAHVSNEALPNGTGEPDQAVVLSRTPVVPKSVRLIVTVNGKTKQWEEIDDLLSAGPEVPGDDLRQPPGVRTPPNPLAEVFTVNPESGEIKFGDGFRGTRPPAGAIMRASYDYGVGQAGNVGPGSIKSSPALPAGLKVENPVRTWNGANAETVNEGEKQITRYLQHRDRLVTAADFDTIARRTPGIDLGRIDVLPAYNPELKPNPQGSAAGSVTLMVIPRFDPNQPTAPMPDPFFLDAICQYLDPRRLVTTEVFLRGPNYIGVWISVGINVLAGASIAEVREEVKQEVLNFLSPLPKGAVNPNGWPLNKPVVDLELVAVASRVSGVLLVSGIKIAQGNKAMEPLISMTGLDLPLVAGISVAVGDPLDIDQVRGQIAGPSTSGLTQMIVAVPVVPETC